MKEATSKAIRPILVSTLELSGDEYASWLIKQYKKNQYIKLNHFKYMDKKIFNTLERNLGEHLLITLKK